MKTALFIFLLALTGLNVSGQDSLQTKQVQNIPNSIGTWTKKHVSVRVALGVRKSFYTDLGIAFQKCNFTDVGFFSRDFYSALEWIPSRNDNIFGLKIGVQANSYLLNVGLEVKYQTDFSQNDFVITPKIGVGICGDLNLFYGYNISTNNRPFSHIGSHQFSLVLNLHKQYLSY